ncbi:MAG: phage Gp37/Gp68 family protein [Syntrophomonas sp.]
MADTKIEWADKTWNPVTGCSPISEGCKNCFAKRMASRLQGRCGYPKDNPFLVVKHDDVFMLPIKWRKPSRIFVCSMGDLFHDAVEERWIDAVFAAMGSTYDTSCVDENNVATGYKQRHVYMVLTKRPERMRDYILELLKLDWESLRKRFYHIAMGMCDIIRGPLYAHMNASMIVATWIKQGMPGLWLGVTAENQARADERIPILLQTPAAVRFVSIEPMLGEIDLTRINIGPVASYNTLAGEILEPGSVTSGHGVNKLDWAICGGETGTGARPMHPDWVRSLRDQCQAAGTPFFFKSWGDWSPFYDRDIDDPDWRKIPEESKTVCRLNLAGGQGFHGDRVVYFKKVGKKKAGRLLDGQEWDQYPGVM